MHKRVFCAALAFGVAQAFTGGAAAAEPPNIFLLKQEIAAYVESGSYERDLAAVAEEAAGFIKARAQNRNGRLAIVLDVDETALSNWAQIHGNDFAYLPERWDAWVLEGRAPAIGPVLRLHRTARESGVAVIFVTGRRERERESTERNLRAAGYTGYAALHVMPDDFHGPTGAWKAGLRKRLAEEGFVIIANIGDQESDLAGGGAERSFKLPCPFYVTE